MNARNLKLALAWLTALAAATAVGCGGGNDMAAPPSVDTDTGDAGRVDSGGGNDGGVVKPELANACVSCATGSQARGGACFDATKACARDEGCVNLAACVNTCPLDTFGSVACMDECMEFASAAAVALIKPVMACLCDTTCHTECGTGCATSAPANGSKHGVSCAAPVRLTREAAVAQ